MKKIILGIDGMKCGMCESHVNDKCRKFSFVKKVKSSHVQNKTEIIADDDADIDALIASIEEDGYRVTDKSIENYDKKSFFSFLKKKN